jgi:hypothetical protein
MTQRRECRIKISDNLKEFVRFDGNGITVTQKGFFDITVIITRHTDIFQDFGDIPLTVLVAFVHPAKCALIVGTADGALKQIA